MTSMRVDCMRISLKLFQKSKTRVSNGSDDMYDWRDYRLYNHATILK